ncbi:Cas10/Cmr2 second palm domain-containing protein [Rhodovulum sulfidophilum]|uniref:Cas10/Cmr2 second palm domain-containing protein n=1 Tax=Rhodovulum sulfidophilum TaxID=35806 RepID=UPI0009532ADF|nr:hypothetical protein [Rhodovulum sulfidophilum]MBL3553151.1 hypothetical protein [Rhodovulum sulfidophilum]OLS50205.1 hypothetical protein BV379_19230 [Rhodovulum sulfidophilum]
MRSAFLFEIAGIQSYVFATGKLRDASGASELISSLAHEDLSDGLVSEAGLFAETIRAASLTGKIRVFRCAGGVVDFTCDTGQTHALYRFRALWRLALSLSAPGLAFRDAVSEGADDAAARGAARRAILQAPPPAHADAPPSVPIVRPAALTDAAPAIWRTANRADGRCRITGDYACAPTLAKRTHLDQGSDDLARLFTAGDAGNYDWPLTFEPDPGRPQDPVFPFPGKVKRVALVHIDGNGVGRFFAGLQGKLSDVRPVSAALAQATKDAAAEAMIAVLKASVPPPGGGKPVVPARPILLGGDDLTVLLRADLALDFARGFSAAFERKTEELFGQIEGLQGHEGLTAKTGIVFMGPKQPFVQAYELCEDLAKEARAETQSRVSFWRLTGAMIPRDADEIKALTSRDGMTFWRKSWAWDEFAKLEDLVEVMSSDEIGRGPLRRVPELAQAGRTGSGPAPEEVYRRALNVLRNRAPAIHAGFLNAMRELGVDHAETRFDADGYVPLLDAHVLGKLAEDQAA